VPLPAPAGTSSHTSQHSSGSGEEPFHRRQLLTVLGASLTNHCLWIRSVAGVGECGGGHLLCHTHHFPLFGVPFPSLQPRKITTLHLHSTQLFSMHVNHHHYLSCKTYNVVKTSIRMRQMPKSTVRYRLASRHDRDPATFPRSIIFITSCYIVVDSRGYRRKMMLIWPLGAREKGVSIVWGFLKTKWLLENLAYLELQQQQHYS